MEMTIEETLRLRADEEKKKKKEFNYKFHNNVSKMKYEENYKRLGIEISKHSQIIQIREFLLEQIATMIYSCVLIILLHDNVD
jgi:ABC-type bacteriocin/lantibiotic exporter with double-glycine peptidase domain